MEKKVQKRNYFEIRSSLISWSQLDSLQICNIIEAGITFFLYQRGQIPLPFESLSLQFCGKDNIQTTFTDIGTESKVTECQQDLSEVHETFGKQYNLCIQTDEIEVPNHLLNGERLKFLVKRKRMILRQKRVTHINNEMFRKESQAKTTVGVALEKLRSVFISGVVGNECGGIGINAIILIFGPSIHTPKEIIRFELEQTECLYGHKQFEKSEQELPLQSLIRAFYKNLILSPDFLDFTSRSLSRTYSHICLETKKEVANESEELIRLENVIADNWMNTRPNRKLLRIKLTGPCGSCLNEKLTGSSTNANNNDNYLFDKNSLCFYQIPLRFKGVKCKSKPVM